MESTPEKTLNLERQPSDIQRLQKSAQKNKERYGINTGLYGIVAGESEITTVGKGTGLNHRGYNINDFVKYNECFEELVYLLLVGELPI